MAEFELIDRYFNAIAMRRDDVVLGIGDDCAVLDLPPGRQLAVSTDTLVAGIHFPQLTSAEDVGYKSLAVNLSDLAAMGAHPAWATLCLTLPEEDDKWLSGFSRGFSELLRAYNIQLVGGDTTHGPLSVTVNVIGFIKPNLALQRSGARPGDKIFVTGSIGDAGLGLKKMLASISHDTGLRHCIGRLNRPTPRLEVGKSLLGISRCAIDISDGLLADLGHICQRSGCGAHIYAEQVPLSAELRQFYGELLPWQDILSAGDDYELCFTLAPDQLDKLEDIRNKSKTGITCIGEISAQTGVQCELPDGSFLQTVHTGFNHFES